MGTLFGNFEIGRKSLLAQQLALQVTGNNIANVNTPGYSREKVVMEPSLPIQTSFGQVGTGVDVKSISSVRDRFVEIRLSQGIQNQSQEEAKLGVLEQVQAAFSVDNTGIQDGITEFFNSFSKLASNPESVPLRNNVITQAQNLTSAFRSSARQLIDIRHSVNSQVSGVVNQVNSLADSIRQINLSIVSAESGGADAAALRDQRGELINQLSELVDVSYYEAQDGTLSVSIAEGHTLVTAGFAHPLVAVSTPPDGMIHVMSGLDDLTNTIGNGKLAGLIEARDTAIPAYQNDLDDLATQIISSVNDQHRLGIDLDGNVGEDFFTPVTPGTSAALTISLNPNVATDAHKIAASQTDPLPTNPAPTANPGHSGAPGDNSNALALANLAAQELVGGGRETFSEGYAALQFRIGNDTQSAQRRAETQSALVTQIKNLRDSVSGVSLDEEAIDMIRYQRAYQASSRFVSLIDQLTGEMMDILGG